MGRDAILAVVENLDSLQRALGEGCSLEYSSTQGAAPAGRRNDGGSRGRGSAAENVWVLRRRHEGGRNLKELTKMAAGTRKQQASNERESTCSEEEMG